MNISTASVSKVIVNASQYGTDVGKIKVTIGDTELDAQSPANGLEFTPSTPINASKIIISTTEKRAYVASISVISGNSSYVDYTTVCGPPAPKYAITCEATTNGTLATNPAAEAAAGRTVSLYENAPCPIHFVTGSGEAEIYDFAAELGWNEETAEQVFCTCDPVTLKNLYSQFFWLLR